MQSLFAEATPWHTPWLKRVLPAVTALAERHPERTIFTRFIPPRSGEPLPGSWARFWQRWEELSRDRLDPRLIELVPPLAALVPPAEILDKRVYSPFTESGLARQLRQDAVDALVISGAETDLCVLATVLDAVDLGFRVVLPMDALCSSSDATHDALMTLYRQRFSEQVETADTAAVLAAWR